jgi:hypothetical protein
VLSLSPVSCAHIKGRHKADQTINDSVVIDATQNGLKPWELPVLPPLKDLLSLNSLPDTSKEATSDGKSSGSEIYNKKIPRHIWIALRNKTEDLNWQMQPLFDRNPKWR